MQKHDLHIFQLEKCEMIKNVWMRYTSHSNLDKIDSGSKV